MYQYRLNLFFKTRNILVFLCVLAYLGFFSQVLADVETAVLGVSCHYL